MGFQYEGEKQHSSCMYLDFECCSNSLVDLDLSEINKPVWNVE